MITSFAFNQTTIPGLIEVTPFSADDLRGEFVKDYSKEIFDVLGYNHDLIECFYTKSHSGVIRALHFQREYQQAKLVRCVHGHIFDVVVDLRPESLAFKEHLVFDLTGDNKKELLIPGGCAHGYLVLEDSIVSYKCNEKFNREFDDGIRYDDPDIGVAWPFHLIGGEENLIIASKDLMLQSFEEFMDKYHGLV